MPKKSYTLKARPDLFELSIMNGYLNGGGNLSNVHREAYWEKSTARNEQTPKAEEE